MAAPLLISVYTRLEHLKKCIDSLLKNELAVETDLFVVSDAPAVPQHKDAIERVREYVRSISGFKSVNLIAWEENKGSFSSIMDARLSIYEKYDCQIFMEDDNVVSPMFLSYINDALKRFKNEPSVFAICGYTLNISIPDIYKYDIYFMNHISANGWATWKDKYFKYLNDYRSPDFNGKVFRAYSGYLQKVAFNLKRMTRQGASWGDTKISYYMFENKMLCAFPCKSLVLNTGWDGSGEHCGNNDRFMEQEINVKKPVSDYPVSPFINPEIEKSIRDYFSYPLKSQIKTMLFDFKISLKKRFS